VFESFAFGVPVIGSRRGGIVEMIEEGLNGILFNPTLPGDLLRAMRQIMKDWTLDDANRNAIRESAAPYLDVAEMARRYQRIAIESIN
jgi:glycosyltransferase involved in cell wall biosynthesis